MKTLAKDKQQSFAIEWDNTDQSTQKHVGSVKHGEAAMLNRTFEAKAVRVLHRSPL